MSQPKWSFRVNLPSRRPLPSPRPLPLSSQMWSCWRWTAPRPAAGSTTNCGLTRSSGRRTTAPSASAWTRSRTARQWPASRAARTRSRSPENAALSAKVRRTRGGGGSMRSGARVDPCTAHKRLRRPLGSATEAVSAWAH